MVWRLWPTKYPRASVIEYHVLQDDTAFLLWTRIDLMHEPAAWLSRVDSSGRTLWLRELPALPLHGNSLHVSDTVVAIRYTHSRDGYDRDHSIVAYSHGGKMLWDKTIAPFYPQPVDEDPKYGKTSAEMPGPSGVVVGDRLVEWAFTGTEWKTVGLDARTGRELWNESGRSNPSSMFVLGQQLLETHAPSMERLVAVRRADVPTGPRVVVRAVESGTGSAQEKEVRGAGCVLDGRYVTLVDNGDVTSLVSFRDGIAAVERVLIENLDFMESPTMQYLESCGRYRGNFVLVLTAAKGRLIGEDARELVIVDARGKVLHRIDLPFDVLLLLDSNTTTQLASDRLPLHGDLPRFVAVTQPAAEGRHGDSVVVLDLEQGTIASTMPTSTLHGTVFSAGGGWYLGNRDRHRVLLLHRIDGKTGDVLAVDIRVAGLGAFDTELDPTHVSSKSVWLVPYLDAAIDAPPMAVLDATTLAPRYVSPSMSVFDKTARVQASRAAGHQ